MTEQRDQPDDEHFSDWLFYTRKHQRRHRTTHTTHSNTTNTQENNK